jgi:hypothetical protein
MISRHGIKSRQHLARLDIRAAQAHAIGCISANQKIIKFD